MSPDLETEIPFFLNRTCEAASDALRLQLIASLIEALIRENPNDDRLKSIYRVASKSGVA